MTMPTYNGRMVLHRFSPFVSLTALVAGIAFAQQFQQPAPVTEEPPPPRYNVEIILFAHSDVDPAEERFSIDDGLGGPDGGPGSMPPARNVIAVETLGPRRRIIDDAADDASDSSTSIDAGAPAATDSLEFLDPFGMLAGQPAGEDPADAATAVRILGNDELMLGDAQRIIDRLGAYRLLGHGGWQQPGLEQDQAVPLDVSRIGIVNPSGTIKLYLGRFLHVTLDLAYRSPIPVAPAPADPAAAALPGPSAFQRRPGRILEEIGLPAVYHLRTERNAIRSGELHYVDHPRFGVLILVTPAPMPAATDESEASDAPSA